MRKYKSYTDEDIKKAVKNNSSISGVLRDLNLVIAGGNYGNIKRKIAKLNCDISHFKVWNKNKQLKEWAEYKNKNTLKRHLIKIRGNKCEECKLEKWLDFGTIKIEMHHVDGNKLNNSESNLKLLCPNCHSFTKGFRQPRF